MLPLSNLRIIDLGWAMAGPQATRLLADFGAEVIKVESRARPDMARTMFGPHVGERSLNSSGYFNNFNRNKRSVTINLSLPAGRKVFERLVAISDGLLENYSAGVMAGWGFDYEGLARLKPTQSRRIPAAANTRSLAPSPLAPVPARSITRVDMPRNIPPTTTASPRRKPTGGRKDRIDAMLPRRKKSATSAAAMRVAVRMASPAEATEPRITATSPSLASPVSSLVSPRVPDPTFSTSAAATPSG